MKSSGQARGSGVSQNRRAGAKNASKQNDTIRNDSPTHPAAAPSLGVNGVTASQAPNLDVKTAEPRVMLYKIDSKAQSASKTESPWAPKGKGIWQVKLGWRLMVSIAGQMANGKDFWIEMRKQVAALQQSSGTSQGG